MSKRPLTKQAQQSQEKKKHIFQIAIHLFAENGYEQTTIRQICTEAEITTGSFYHFFGDKLGLIKELYIDMQEVGAAYLQLTEENLRRPFQSILNAFTSATNTLGNLPGDLAQRLLTESTKIMNGHYDVSREDTILYQLTVFLSEAQRRGSISPDLNPEETAVYCIAVSSGFSHYWLYRTPHTSMEQMVRIILIPAFRSLTTEELIYPDSSEGSVK